MVIFTIKLLSSVRKAIAGRKHPNQLAWAVALGVLLGIVPHGNILALAMLIVVLSLRVNHAMAGVTAVGASFLAAAKLDPWSDRVGNYVLTHDATAPLAAQAWQLPLVPWTDLNNTVVMGSLLIGLAALLPIFLLTYPIFRLFAPATESSEDVANRPRIAHAQERLFVDSAHDQPLRPNHSQPPAQPEDAPLPVNVTASARNSPSTASVDQYLATIDDQPVADDRESHQAQEPDNRVSVETRIDVIRMKDYRDVSGTDATAPQTQASDDVTEEPPLDEALNYLLRQLRDSQQRKAG